MPISRKRFLFIINPVSGGVSKSDYIQQIHDHFIDKGLETERYELRGEGDDISIKYWIDTWKPDTVVALGGDGTVKALAALTMNTPLNLAILPAGSSNGMAKALDLPDSFEACLELLTEGV